MEWEKRLGADGRLQPFGDDMFGDTIDPHTGTLQFETVDVSLPGNNGLAVEVRRRRIQGPTYASGARHDFGDWEFITPRITLVTHWRNPWDGNRCSQWFSTQFDDVPVFNDLNRGQRLDPWEYGQAPQVIVGGSIEYLLDTHTTSNAAFPANARFVTESGWYFTCIPASQGAVTGFWGMRRTGMFTPSMW